jgi:hypothetical protein
MKRKQLALFTFIVAVVVTANATAALTLRNGDFDLDPDLGGSDDPVTAPTHWFVHYDIPQSWSDFRFGNDGNGGWNNNGIALGQNYLGDFFEPGPEDGYYYTSLGLYSGELSARIDGFGYNRTRADRPAGNFEVGVYYSPGASFMGANGSDVASGNELLARLVVDLSALNGTTPLSQPFTLPVDFVGSGILPGDEVWLRFFDIDDMDLNSLDEPIIDNVSLTTVVPEPSSLALLAAAGAAAVTVLFRRRRAQ